MLLVFGVPFALMWFLATRYLRSRARMNEVIDGDLGPRIRTSKWGSAVINGVPASNCVKIEEYADGWVLRLMPLLGGGRLWLRKGLTTIGRIEHGRAQSTWRTVTFAQNVIIVHGRLADFFDEVESVSRRCDECGSMFFAQTSRMDGLCPECAHHLYGEVNCTHRFANGHCAHCGWDGSRSDYVRSLIEKRVG